MKNLLAAAAVLLALSFPVAAHAQSACQYTLDTTASELTAAEMPFIVVDDPELVAKAIEALAGTGTVIAADVTRIFVAIINGRYFYGIEVGGCLSPPQPVPASLIPTAHLSGRYSFGTFA